MGLLVKTKRHFFSCLIILIIFINGCKEPDNVGLEVLPISDLSSLSYSDTVSLETSVVREDSVPSTANLASLLGAISDNLFGNTYADFYTQLFLTSGGVSFGSSPASCDSIILTLAYSGYYGDTLATHNFEVYRLQESIADSTIYYSNKIFNISDLIGNLSTNDIRPADSVQVNGKNASPHLRIPLSNNILAPIFFNSSSTSIYESNSAFTSYFKGIYVKDNTIPATGSILYFNLNDTMSKVTLYYKDSLSFTFPLSKSHTVNHFDHNNYSSAVFVNNFNDTDFGKNLCYVQSMAGIKTKVDFPFLDDLIQNGNISVNKAELVITIDNSTTATYPAHNKLFLVGIDSAGAGYFLPDYDFNFPDSFGGSQSSGTYTFHITRYIQQVLTGKRKNYGLFIVASGASTNANRTVIGGSDHSSIPMKLKLSYTNINP